MGCLDIPLLILLILGEMVLCADIYFRNDFPSDFVFGAGSSAYQVEGAAFEDGRTPSIWDTFAHAGNAGGATGDVACDVYHKYKEDVQLMVETGLEAYRFSISWSRLIPNGRGDINQKAVSYYNNFIDELILHGIEPHVTLLHSDLPQILEDEYEGLLSRQVVKDFVAYVEVCFTLFGDRVLHWTTFNEANVFVLSGYDTGFFPPSRCSQPFGIKKCSKGNSTYEPYLAAHNILLAHSAAARLYKLKYQGKQRGIIGINILAYWFIPDTNATEDVIATQRAYDFYIGWIIDPLVFGDYPKIMKKNAGKRIPVFSKEESKQIKGSFDFMGVNHYTASIIRNRPSSLDIDKRDIDADLGVEMINDALPGEVFAIKPTGMQGVLEYFKQVYGNPPVYIHENGHNTPRNSTLNDTTRVEYMHGYIGSLLDAVRNGSNTRGYFVWSFLDLFEMFGGFEFGYGLYYVDLDDKDLKRYPKLSANWYSSFLKGKNISVTGDMNISSTVTVSHSYSSQ